MTVFKNLLVGHLLAILSPEKIYYLYGNPPSSGFQEVDIRRGSVSSTLPFFSDMLSIFGSGKSSFKDAEFYHRKLRTF